MTFINSKKDTKFCKISTIDLTVTTETCYNIGQIYGEDFAKFVAFSEYINFNEKESTIELVSKELNHLVAILHVYAGGLNFMK